MAEIRVGKPDVRPDTPAHTPGIKQSGHNPDGTSTAERSTGINPKLRNPIDPSMPNLSPG